MDKFQYSMDALMICKEFSAVNAVKNFPDTQAYFDKLTEFTQTWHNYLYLYDPAVLIHGEEMCKSFQDDLEEIRKAIAPLELTLVPSKLDALDNMLNNNDDKGLAHGLAILHSMLRNVSHCITEARIPVHSTVSAAGISRGGELPLILAVDDKPELLSTISGVLRSKYKVIAVTSGNAAIKALEAHNPALFLLDIEMPGMNGYELAKKIRESGKFDSTPIIFLTSKATREHVVNAVAHGGNEYLLKPVDASILLGKIQHLLNEVKI